MQNNDISEIIAMESKYFTGCLSHASKFSAHICFCRMKFFHVEKTVGHEQKFYGRENATLHDFTL